MTDLEEWELRALLSPFEALGSVFGALASVFGAQVSSFSRASVVYRVQPSPRMAESSLHEVGPVRDRSTEAGMGING